MWLTAFGADVYKHNLDITVGGGLQSIQFNPEEGEHTAGPGALFNIMYRYNFNQHWGIGAGVGLGFYNAHSKYDSLRLTKMLVHPENGHEYERSGSFDDWNEVQRMLDFEVPFGVYFTTPLTKHEKWNFLTSAGVKFNLPFWNKYKIVEGTLETKGFFEEYTNIEYSNLPQHGFYTQDYFEGNADLRKAGASVYLDVAFTRQIKDKNMALYLGAYAAYRFTNMVSASTTPLYDLEDDSYIGVLSSDQEDKAKSISAGIKVGLTFGFPKIDTAALNEEKRMQALMEQQRINDSIQAVNDSLAAVQAELDRLAAERAKAVADSLVKVEEAQKQVELKQAEEVVNWLSKNIQVNFALAKSDVEVTPEVAENIMFIAKYLKKNPDQVLVVTGHTCNLGKREKNMELSRKRAEAMKKVLVENGCNPANIQTVGKGPDEPMVPNTSEANRKKNRRIEIKIEKYKASDVE